MRASICYRTSCIRERLKRPHPYCKAHDWIVGRSIQGVLSLRHFREGQTHESSPPSVEPLAGRTDDFKKSKTNDWYRSRLILIRAAATSVVLVLNTPNNAHSAVVAGQCRRTSHLSKHQLASSASLAFVCLVVFLNTASARVVARDLVDARSGCQSDISRQPQLSLN